MSSKPYLAGKQEYLEYMKRKDWINPDTNPDDLAEYSEFQKPYALGDREDDSYPAWEWNWPPISIIPLDPITYPDPVENPCNIEASCTWAGISGANEMTCGECQSYTHIHVWESCPGDLPYEAAFGGWFLSGGNGKCYLIPGLVIARVCCDDDAGDQQLVLYWDGIGCSAEYPITVKDCVECPCEPFTISGSGTATTNSTWTGTVDPACPGATCEIIPGGGGDITDYSGCTLNEAGDEVQVSIAGGACGTFTVSMVGCNDISSSTVVRITDGGGWGDSVDSCDQGDDCGISPGTCSNLAETYCVADANGEGVCWAVQQRWNGSCKSDDACKASCVPSSGRCYYFSKYVPWTCDGESSGWSGNC